MNQRTARTCNNKEPRQKYGLGTVSIKILGALNRFYGIPTSPSASVMAQNIQLFGPRECFLTHQWIITGNKSDKYYDETKMRTRQKQRVATDTRRSPGCRTTQGTGILKSDCKQPLRIGIIRALNECTGRLFRATTRHNHKSSDMQSKRIKGQEY